MYNIGDKIVYPMHGAGVIEAIEEKIILGKKQFYYIMKMTLTGEMTVMIPCQSCDEIGVRFVIDKNNKSVLIFIHPNMIQVIILNAKYATIAITHQLTKLIFSSDFLNNTKTASIAITVKQ